MNVPFTVEVALVHVIVFCSVLFVSIVKLLNVVSPVIVIVSVHFTVLWLAVNVPLFVHPPDTARMRPLPSSANVPPESIVIDVVVAFVLRVMVSPLTIVTVSAEPGVVLPQLVHEAEDDQLPPPVPFD
jgi:hypothetical protein